MRVERWLKHGNTKLKRATLLNFVAAGQTTTAEKAALTAADDWQQRRIIGMKRGDY